MKYKAGDRVKIKNLDWYNKNKKKSGNVWTNDGKIPFGKNMSKWCNKVMTISDVRADHYTMIEDLVGYWTDEMIEGLAEELLDKEMEEHQRMCDEIMAIQGIEPIEAEMEQIIHCPEGYIFKDERGNEIHALKIVLEKKSPKTDNIIKWLREHDLTKYIGVIYSGMCSITFDTEGLINDFLKAAEDSE